MKQNLMILCQDYEFSKTLSEELSDFFSMRILDELELLQFNFAPLSLQELLDAYGENFVIDMMAKNISSECSYENIISISHLKVIRNCEDIFSKIKENNFIILVKGETAIENEDQNSIFNMKSSEISETEDLISSELSDEVVSVENKSISDIKEIIIQTIRNFYNLDAS